MPVVCGQAAAQGQKSAVPAGKSVLKQMTWQAACSAQQCRRWASVQGGSAAGWVGGCQVVRRSSRSSVHQCHSGIQA